MNVFSKRLLFVATIYLASSIAVPARADVVTDWNNAALDAIRANNTPPPIASRSLAILHASIYDAVNGIARTNEPYLVPSVAPATASRPAAASAAAHRTLVHLFPANASSFDALNATILAGIPDGPRKRAGILWENSSPTSYLSHAPMMVPMLLCSHPAAAAPACGYLLRQRYYPICYRNGDSSRRLQ